MRVLRLGLLSLAGTTVLGYQVPRALRPREDEKCQIQLANSNGGRYIGIVIDSSGSMTSTDPSDVRVPAGKELNRQLVTRAAAGPNLKADEVTVVDFDGVATVIYPLGDPAGAESSFDSIDSNGSTDIAAGIDAAVAEITTASDISGKAGIVVLTDGGSSLDPILTAISNAQSLGIRVSFGFLASASAPSSQAPEIEHAILSTGGTFMSFDSAENIRPWLFLLLSNGLTAADRAVENGQPLLPGITVSKLNPEDASSAVEFSYAAQADEGLVFTVSSLSGQELAAELQDADGKKIAGNSTTPEGDAAVIAHTTDGKGDLKLVVTAAGAPVAGGDDSGVFQVNLNSTLGISGCSLNNTRGPGGSNSTGRPPNGTVPTTTALPPAGTTSSLPTVPTGAAGKLAQVGFAGVAFLAALVAL